MEPTFCSGYGSTDTHAVTLSNGRPNQSPKAGQPYDQVTLSTIWAMVQNPPSVDKEKAQWIIPSSYNEHDARSHRAQRENGSYAILAADIDRGSPSLEQVREALERILGNCAYLIHSSRSATPENLKWRIILPLANPLSGIEYGAYQAALFDGLEACGLTLDRSLERTGQLVYLPNRGEFYQFEAGGVDTLDAHAHPMRGRADQYIAIAHEAHSSVQASSSDGFRSHIGAFRRRHSIDELLELYGLEQSPSNPDLWRHPDQSTKGYGSIRIMRYPEGERWVSLSDTFNGLGIGRVTASGARSGDQFDLYLHYNCNGDTALAEAYAKQCLADEDDQRYGVATAAHGLSLLADGFLQCNGEAHPLTPEALARKQRVLVQEREHDTEQIEELEMRLKEAEQQRWNGAWMNDVPFSVEKSALEWAAWHAPGVLGEIVRAKAPMALRKSLVSLLAGAIGSVCYLTQGKFVLRYNQFVTPSAVMIYLLGQSGSGKSDAADTLYEVDNLVTEKTQIMCAKLREFSSGEAVTHFLATQTPNVIIMQNEAGAKRSSAQGSNRHESVIAETTDIFTAFKRGIEATHAKTQGLETKAVTHPTLSALLTSTPEKLFATIKNSDAESGWLGRYLFMPLPNVPRNKGPNIQPTFPAHVHQHVNRLAMLSPPLPTLDSRVWNGQEGRAFHAMWYTPEAATCVDALEDDYDIKARDLRRSSMERSVYGRAAEAVHRLAFIAGLATSIDRPIDVYAVQWATVVVEANLKFLTSKMDHAEAFEESSPAGKVRIAIRRYFEQAEDEAWRKRSFGVAGRIGIDGHVELAKWKLRTKLKENLRGVETRIINAELEGLIEDQTILCLGKDWTGKEWLRWV